jgi:hypothetical protein
MLAYALLAPCSLSQEHRQHPPALSIYTHISFLAPLSLSAVSLTPVRHLFPYPNHISSPHACARARTLSLAHSLTRTLSLCLSFLSHASPIPTHLPPLSPLSLRPSIPLTRASSPLSLVGSLSLSRARASTSGMLASVSPLSPSAPSTPPSPRAPS